MWDGEQTQLTQLGEVTCVCQPWGTGRMWRWGKRMTYLAGG